MAYMNDTKTDFRTQVDVTGTAGVPAPQLPR